MKKYILLSLSALFLSTLSHATVWRVNNNIGVDADFTTMAAALAHASVINGDTIHIEPSSTNYGTFNITKQLVFIGNGYLLDGSNNGNAGLQENLNESRISHPNLNAGSEGSVFLGLTITSYLHLNTISSASNIKVEKCRFNSSHIFYASGTRTFDDLSVRKCYMHYHTLFTIFSSNITLNNFTIENCIFRGGLTLTINPASLNVIFRNNTLLGQRLNTNNAYVANNLFLYNGVHNFTSCVVKNNLFVYNQLGITVGPLNTNGNNLVSQTLANLIVNTGSYDGKAQLAVASPAIDGGVDIGGVKPDCGAFGGNDPYVLSGIPNIPTIYSMSFPNGNTIPAGTPTIDKDFSTRNNK